MPAMYAAMQPPAADPTSVGCFCAVRGGAWWARHASICGTLHEGVKTTLLGATETRGPYASLEDAVVVMRAQCGFSFKSRKALTGCCAARSTPRSRASPRTSPALFQPLESGVRTSLSRVQARKFAAGHGYGARESEK